jgi:hypothetical protein
MPQCSIVNFLMKNKKNHISTVLIHSGFKRAVMLCSKVVRILKTKEFVRGHPDAEQHLYLKSIQIVEGSG